MEAMYLQVVQINNISIALMNMEYQNVINTDSLSLSL